MPAITVHEVGPRDGLQNESAVIATTDKVTFINALADAGLLVVEVSAFVSPSRVPQMADADDVCRLISRREGTRYSALVPNVKGLDRALAAGLTDVAVFAAASETFSQRNINQSIAASLANYRRSPPGRSTPAVAFVRISRLRSAVPSKATCPSPKSSR